MAKVKIPKRVGGVKIPKKVRRKAKKALKVAESREVREFAARALGAAAGARARPRAARVRIDGDRLADTVRGAVLDGLRRFMEGFEEGLREAEAKAAEAPSGRAAAR